ncbi:MAG: hypothetical protein MJH10_11775 [Epibacterium sp.]|nr:hypothetical protein [Epibacterium sp.]NQX74225.1 hypothetical protein [Epibacterium sp.]
MKPIAGLHRENSFINQPENTYRSALNMILESPDGDRGSLSNESGNETCYTLDPGFLQVGSILINNDTQVIFSTDETTSKIGLVKDCTYTEIVESNCLGFSRMYPIKGVFRVKNNDRFIYWVDGFNSDRALNIDKLSDYYTDAFATYLSGGGDPALYGSERYECSLIRLDAIFSIPDVEELTVNNGGGNLPVGSYAIAFRYEDGSKNVTNIARTTRAFDIVDESVVEDTASGSYSAQVDGAYNLEAGDLDGAVPATNKSVTFDLSNVDTSFRKLQMIVLYAVNGDRTAAAYLVDEIAITDSELSWTFTGIDPNSTVVVDISEINVDTVVYESSKSIDIVSDRLVRGNVKTTEIDWKEFQTLVSQNVVPKFGLVVGVPETSSKEGSYRFDRQSYMRDEVYAFAVVYNTIYGTKSPPLHIPGRPEITDSGVISTYNANTHPRPTITGTPSMDKQLLTVVASGAGANQVNLDDVRHLGITTAGGTIENWKVFNTAVDGERFMGYYEGTSDYPDIRDASDTPIYPHTNLGGGNYQMHKIRHHRMPDAALVRNISFVTLADSIELGVEFTGLDSCIPAQFDDQIVSYEIVRVKREEFNKTVVDTAVVQGVRIDNVDPTWAVASVPYNFERNSASSGLFNNDLGHIMLYSPRLAFEGALNFDYLQVSYELEEDVNYFTTASPSPPNHGQVRSFLDPFVLTRTMTNTTVYNIPIISRKYISENTQEPMTTGEILLNYSAMPGMLCQVDTNYSDVTTRLENSILPTDDSFDTTASPPRAKHVIVTMKRQVSPYNSLDNLVYISCSNKATPKAVSLVQLFGGDVFHARFGYRKVSDDITQNEDTRKRENESSYVQPLLESEINTNLRHGYTKATTIDISGTTYDVTEGQYFPKHFTNDLKTFLGLPISLTNVFEYNFDYSWEQNIDTVTAEDFSIERDAENPNLLVWSETSLPFDIGDGFKITRANSYKAIPATQGDIVDIAYYRNRLYVFTELSVFQLIPNPQQLQTDASVITVGTGEFLGVPEVELVEADAGYAGCVGRFVLQKTEYGLFFVSRDRVYKLLDGIEDISAKGMYSWFDANLESKFIEKYNSQNSTPFASYDVWSDADFVGIYTTYDPLNQRFIIHKRDYSTVIGSPVYSNMAVSGEWTRESWTLSYDIKTGVWSSFHSYMPRSMTYDRNFMYTSRDNNEIYVHKPRSLPMNFYGVQFDCDVQLCVPTQIPTNLHSLSWITRVTADGITDENETFTRGFVYNTKQCSGLLSFAIKGDYENAVTYSDFAKYITRVDNTYRVGQLRNMLNDPTDNRVNLTNINVTDRYDAEQGYSEPLPPVITGLDQYNQSLLKDRYHIIHLIYTGNKYMVIDEIDFKLSKSFR